MAKFEKCGGYAEETAHVPVARVMGKTYGIVKRHYGFSWLSLHFFSVESSVRVM